MYPPVSHKSPWGIFLIILGITLFLIVAGEFLVKLLLAFMALWLIAYGVQLHTGRSVNIMFWHRTHGQ
jgi:multisubunit Na+/H+ antiporter MnhG subunit